MKEHENSLNPEDIDRQTERWPAELSPEESRLVQNLYAHAQAYARENERSLESVWNRFVQRQEQPVSLQEEQQQIPGEKPSFRKGKAMQGKDFSERTGLPILNAQPLKRPRRSLGRIASMIGAVAIVALIILSWALLTYGLKHGTPNRAANNGHTAQTGAAQQNIHGGTLLCSFSDNNNAVQNPQQPSLDWSAQGQIAATYLNLKIASAHNCAAQASYPLPLTQANWSSDGTRLLALNPSGTAQVLNASTGKVIASFQGNKPDSVVDQSAWSSNGTQVISEVTTISKTSSQSSIQVWDASSGKYIRTAITFPAGVQFLGVEYGQPSLSSNGKYVAVQLPNNSIQVWNIATGTQVGAIPFNQSGVSAEALSLDGSSLALGLLNAAEVQIWSTATGKLSASFKDSDTWGKVIGWLSWSPNGKYLAESTSVIHIWDAQAQKIVATFGNVGKSHWISTLAWSSNSAMLASTDQLDAVGQTNFTHDTVNVWQLS